jgi:hypothetical protein
VTKQTTFDGRIFAVASEDGAEAHPYQSQLRFVFTDFGANANKQGVRKEEAANIISTSKYMPVKVNFDGELVYGHKGAIPVGPILNMREESGVLVADAILWRDEFPELATYLSTASATEGAASVNFSWELYYKDSEIDEAGVEWLSGVTVAGATIVDNPAYRGRTHLITMAEEGVATRLESVETLVQQMLSELKELRSTSMADVETVDDTATSEETGTQDTTVGEVAQEFTSVPTADFTALQDELTTLRAFKQDIERKAAEATLLKSRRESLDSIGIASVDMNDEQLAFILGMSDAQFTTYLDTTKEIVKKAGSKANSESRDGKIIPDATVISVVSTPDISALAKSLRKTRAAS